jgi:hypothetical protein
MALTKYPHTATITYLGVGTNNTYGVWTPGTATTVRVLQCDIQPAGNSFISGEGGAVLNYDWDIYSPLFSGSTSIPKKAELTFFNQKHILVQIFNHQTHVEMKCKD